MTKTERDRIWAIRKLLLVRSAADEYHRAVLSLKEVSQACDIPLGSMMKLVYTPYAQKFIGITTKEVPVKWFGIPHHTRKATAVTLCEQEINRIVHGFPPTTEDML